MWTPNSIEELLDERISFCQNNISGLNKNLSGNDNHEVISNFTKSLSDYEYCKKLLLLTNENPDDTDIKRRFKNQAIKVIMDINHSMDLQEMQCVSIHGTIHAISDKSYLPEEQKDNFMKLRSSLKLIFDKIMSIN